MRPLARRRIAAAAILSGAAAAFYVNGLLPAQAADAPGLQHERIELGAVKFGFAPGEIRVKKGSRVTIVLTSPDFVHGFSVPDFSVRADGIPGKTVEVTIVADKAGKFVYLCDNFCGEGHDRMSGFLIVTESQRINQSLRIATADWLASGTPGLPRAPLWGFAG